MRNFLFILGLFYATAAHAVCPDGYTSATGGANINDCYMVIAPGYYWTGSAVEICPAEHACTGGNMSYGNRNNEWGIVTCTGSSATSYTGMAYCGCPIDPLDGQRGSYNVWEGQKVCYKHTTVRTYLGINEHTTGYAYCYWNGTNYAEGSSFACDKYTITACAAGYYAPTTSSWGRINCVPVESGYYSSDDATQRTVCPAGTTTIGYGLGADEAADCGVALHIGDVVVHLRSEKRTTHALHVRVGNQTFYGDMTTAPKGKIRVKIGDTVYSVYDDSM